MDDAPTFQPGDRLFDRYLIRSVFGGGMGVLYVVVDEHTGRSYAVKTVKPSQAGDEAIVSGFIDQARIWIDLDRHENLVQALWLETDAEKAPYLFLEFVDGPDLERLLIDGPLPLPRCLDLAMQFAAGMAYAHTKPLPTGVGLVHRDLKPSNLLLGPGDVLKVADFGLAKIFKPRSGAPRTADGGGTLAYMAPEQLRSAETIDGRADVYAFGLVLYEMLTGANPLRADNIQDQIQRVLTHTPPLLTDVPPAVEALVARCVAKDPDGRPRDFHEVLGHLAAAGRSVEYAWHIGPETVPPPRAGIAATATEPHLRPRRPRVGQPFAVEIEVHGDLGPGPVEVTWQLPAFPGLRVLSPGRRARQLVEAGGGVRLNLRVQAVGDTEGTFEIPPSWLELAGPTRRQRVEVAATSVEVAYSFQLPLLGRDKEQARVERLLVRATNRESSALLVTGETGSGKSRLLVAAERRAAERGLRVVESHADERGFRPMRLVHDAARELLGVPHGDVKHRAAARRIAATVRSLLGDDEAGVRYFTDLLLGDNALENEAPRAHRWYSLLKAAAQREPILLILDQVQRSDPAAIRILLHAIERSYADRLPVCFILGAATGESDDKSADALLLDGWRELADRGVEVESVALQPLGPEDTSRLLDEIFPGHGFAEEAPWLAPAIFEQSGGNLAHLTEIFRSLRLGERSPIRRTNGQWRLDAGFTPERMEEFLPRGLDDVLLGRRAGLAADARAVLDVCALAGQEFDVEVVRRAVQEPTRQGEGTAAQRLELALEELEAADWIVPAHRQPDRALDRYRFRTAAVPAWMERFLAREDAERTRLIHLALAEAMLLSYEGERRARRALKIARHLRKGGAALRSLRLTLVGCERLLNLQLPERARQMLLEAMPLLELEKVSPSEHRLFLYLYGSACEGAGDYVGAYAALTEYVEALTESETAIGTRSLDTRSLARAYTRLGRIHQARGEYDRAVYSFECARQFLEEVGDRRALALAWVALGGLALRRGHVLEAERHWRRADSLARETSNELAAVRAVLLHGHLKLALGETDARAAFARAEDEAVRLADSHSRAEALEGLALVDMQDGYLDRATQRIQEALDIYSRIGDRRGLARTLLRHGDAQQARGRSDRALRDLRRAQRVFEEMGHKEGTAIARLRIGDLLRRRGKVTAAVQELAIAAETLQELRAADRSQALWTLGAALADGGHVRAARLSLARADRLERSGGKRRSHRVQSRALRAEMYEAAGDLHRARMWADRALLHCRRAVGHNARIRANLAASGILLRSGDVTAARRRAEIGHAFSLEEGDVLGMAHAERILMEIAACAGDIDEVKSRAHRAARAYTMRADSGADPARLVLGLARGLRKVAPGRAARYQRVARRCYDRLGSWGYREEMGSEDFGGDPGPPGRFPACRGPGA